VALSDSQLASASEDKTVKVWDVAVATCVATLRGHSGWVLCLAVLGDAGSCRLVSASEDKCVKVWDGDDEL